MRAMRYSVATMTGLVIAATFYEAWFGSDVGLVLIGFAISVAGIFTLAFTGAVPGERNDPLENS